jgi:hypothetical protein
MVLRAIYRITEPARDEIAETDISVSASETCCGLYVEVKGRAPMGASDCFATLCFCLSPESAEDLGRALRKFAKPLLDSQHGQSLDHRPV